MNVALDISLSLFVMFVIFDLTQLPLLPTAVYHDCVKSKADAVFTAEQSHHSVAE